MTGESLVVWTTTPWTLPANVAAAVHPEIEYGRTEAGEWVAVQQDTDEHFVEVKRGSDLVGWRYVGPFDDLAPEVDHRVIAWAGVELSEGTGIVHIAPGCGREDFELRSTNDLAVLTPVDEAGRFYPSYGWLGGLSTDEAAEPITEYLRTTGRLAGTETISHSYPHCWRCDTPLIFRVSDDWFISVEGVRQAMLDENQTVEWTPPQYGKRMDDWLRNMGDWNISRRRFYGLPLPFYPCDCGHVNVIGSREELKDRAVGEIADLAELHRPWIDRVQIRCAKCDSPVQRVAEVGDVWLDAGIVPFSTLGWHNDQWREGGYATGAAHGLTTADLPDHTYWEQWFPATWVTEMREQIRLWFYSMFFMSIVLTGRVPFRKVLTFEKLLDADGREMHGSWGNLISADDAFERMGADVMRWMYSRQPPTQNIRFGFGPADEIKRRLLTLWNSVRFLTDYAAIEGFQPVYEDLDGDVAGVELRSLDRWLLARVQQLVAEAETAYDVVPHRRRRSCRRVVRGRPLELVHPPLAQALLLVGRGGVPRAVDRARAARARVLADHAVPRRAPVAAAGHRTARRCSLVGLSGGLSARCARPRGRGAARRDRTDTAGRRARAARPRGGGCEAAPAAEPALRPRGADGRGPPRGDPAGAASQERRLRRRTSGERAAATEPARARPAPGPQASERCAPRWPPATSSSLATAACSSPARNSVPTT